MTTQDTSVTMRRCIGSTTFGIAAHEAPPSDFPIQPSGKDGLGRMCKTDWNRYTNALRKASLARKAAGERIVAAAKADGATITARQARALVKLGVKAPAVNSTRKPKATRPESPKVRRARAVVAATESLGGTAYTDAVGSDEVQSALAVIAGGQGLELEAPEAVATWLAGTIERTEIA